MSDFERKIRALLKQPLPGSRGQIKMSPRPVNESRFQFKQRPNAREGAVLILFYPDQGEFYLPLIKRPSYEGAHGGQVSLPGGKLEEGDENLIDTALREAEEEIGIDRSQVEVLGQMSQLYIPASDFVVLPVVGIMSEKPNFKPDSYEVARILLTPFERLLDPNYRKEKRMTISHQYQIDSPFYDIEEEVVWGATAMILSELVTAWEEFE